MTNKSIVLPKNWGDDPLSDFQAKAFENELHTFASIPQWQKMLLDVTSVLHKCSSHVIKLVLKTDEPSAILLFLTAHSQYLALARSVSAGHCLAAYPTGRVVVESALYSWYLSTNTEAALRWYEKPTNKDDLKQWSNEFNFSSLTNRLSKINKDLANSAKHLYQFAIDFGAHPNKDALYSNVMRERSEDGLDTILMMYLHKKEGPLFMSTAKFAVETGMIAICLFALGFPDIAKSLNLTQEISRLATNLSSLQK